MSNRNDKNKGKKGNHAFSRFINKREVEEEEKPQKKQAYRVPGKVKPTKGPVGTPSSEPMRLNRFIAMAGVCSRREADNLIAKGNIKINGKVVTELGTKVDPMKDKVFFGNKALLPQNFVYILLNKPKNYITTVKDDKGRATVMELVQNMTRERVYPVGRLDRNTTGLLLLTNDGELAKRLTHPSYNVGKLYQVRLDKEFAEEDLEQLQGGLTLEDGPIKVDKAGYVVGKPMNEVGVEIHSGRNRIVRRMFEHLGYQVIGLDRMTIGSLTKKKLPRGKARFLDQKEIGWLKMIGN